MTKPQSQNKTLNWEENLTKSLEITGTLKTNPNIHGGEPTIGNTRFTLSELIDYVRDQKSQSHSQGYKDAAEEIEEGCFSKTSVQWNWTQLHQKLKEMIKRFKLEKK